MALDFLSHGVYTLLMEKTTAKQEKSESPNFLPLGLLKHGAQYAYKTRKCRCPECKKWKRDDMRLYMRARRARGKK